MMNIYEDNSTEFVARKRQVHPTSSLDGSFESIPVLKKPVMQSSKSAPVIGVQPKRSARKNPMNQTVNGLPLYETPDLKRSVRRLGGEDGYLEGEDENEEVEEIPVETKWRREEDEALREGVKALGTKNWRRISDEYFGGRHTETQCYQRYQKIMKSGLIKGPWTKEEDEMIVECIKKGMTKWSDIAAHVPGRVGKQCRERWFNHLDPSVKKSEWTSDEDLKLISLQRQYGNKWSEIAKMMPGRSENAVKNRWNSAMRKKLQNKLEQDSQFNCIEPIKPRPIKTKKNLAELPPIDTSSDPLTQSLPKRPTLLKSLGPNAPHIKSIPSSPPIPIPAATLYDINSMTSNVIIPSMNIDDSKKYNNSSSSVTSSSAVQSDILLLSSSTATGNNLLLSSNNNINQKNSIIINNSHSNNNTGNSFDLSNSASLNIPEPLTSNPLLLSSQIQSNSPLISSSSSSSLYTSMPPPLLNTNSINSSSSLSSNNNTSSSTNTKLPSLSRGLKQQQIPQQIPPPSLLQQQQQQNMSISSSSSSLSVKGNNNNNNLSKQAKEYLKSLEGLGINERDKQLMLRAFEAGYNHSINTSTTSLSEDGNNIQWEFKMDDGNNSELFDHSLDGFYGSVNSLNTVNSNNNEPPPPNIIDDIELSTSFNQLSLEEDEQTRVYIIIIIYRVI